MRLGAAFLDTSPGLVDLEFWSDIKADEKTCVVLEKTQDR